jgi:hypothetical protein
MVGVSIGDVADELWCERQAEQCATPVDVIKAVLKHCGWVEQFTSASILVLVNVENQIGITPDFFDEIKKKEGSELSKDLSIKAVMQILLKDGMLREVMLIESVWRKVKTNALNN